ncbi:MAG: pilus assembly protein N-terminal domain-containing protein [Hyphomicrobiaceae bacterium]|nr:pilus assembly protein N-terminal domain-containing protein [Hyphomicrobiaceae bacterium]
MRPDHSKATTGLAAALARQIAGIILLAGVCVTPAPTAAVAADLIVRYDQSQLLRMPRPVSEVIIGNPSIADVTVQGNNLLVVTGKTFGVTNIIALDADKNVIQDQRVIVQRDDARVVNLHKGSQRQSYTCSPNCTPTITIGDESGYFELISKHARAKTSFSDSTSDPAGANAQ